MKNIDDKSFLELSKKNNNKKLLTESNFLEKIKLDIFNILYLCLNYSNYSGIELIVVAIFESFQFLYFLFIKIFSQEWSIQKSNKIFLNLFKILRCLLIFPDFRDSSFSLFIILLFFSLFLNLGILTLFILIGCLFKKRIKIPSYLVKILSNIINIYNSILLIPLLEVFIPLFHCKSFFKYRYETLKVETSFCNSAKAQFYFCISIIGGFLCIIYSLIFSTLFYNISIKYNNYLGRINPILNICATFVKISVVITGEIFIYGSNHNNINNQVLVSGIFLILFLFFYIMNKLRGNFYLDITKKVYSIITIVLLFTGICLFMRSVSIKFKFTSFDGYFELWVIIILFVIIYQGFYPNKYEKIINKLPKTINSPRESYEYILTMLKIFINNEKKENSKNFKHFIKKHLYNCKEEFCYLKVYKREILDKKNFDESKMSYEEINKIKKKMKNDESQILFKYIDYIFNVFLNKFPNNNTLKLFFCIFSLEKRNKLNIAKYYLQAVLENKPKLYQQFIIFQIEKKIEEKNTNFSDDIFTVDITNSLVYDKYLNQFQNQIEILGHNYQEFWKSFSVDDSHNINISKIEENGFKILDNIEQIFFLWKKIEKLIQNPIKAKILYGKFIMDILSDEILGQNLIDQSRKISLLSHNHSYQLFKNDINDLSIDGSPLILAKANQNFENLRIVQLTNSILRIFGYIKNDLLNEDINVLLPKIFRKKHSEIVKNYINQNLDSRKIKSRKINSFALHRMGYIFPVKIQFILLPTLDHNFLYGAKFKYDSEREYNYQGFAFINQKLDIINISSQCLKLFNFSSYTFYRIKNPKKVKNERVNLKNCIQELSPQIINTFVGKSSRPLTQRLNEKNNNNNEKTNNDITSRTNEVPLIKKYMDEPDTLVHLYNYEQILNLYSEIYSDNTDRTQKNNNEKNDNKNINLSPNEYNNNKNNNITSRGSISVSSGKIFRVDTKKSSQNPNKNNNNIILNNLQTTPVLINISEILLKNFSIGYYLVSCEYSFRNNIVRVPSIGIKNKFKSNNSVNNNNLNKFKISAKQFIYYDFNKGFIIDNKNNSFKYSFSEYLKKKEKKDFDKIPKSVSHLNLPKISAFHESHFTFHKLFVKDSQINSTKDNQLNSVKDQINSTNIYNKINFNTINSDNNEDNNTNNNISNTNNNSQITSPSKSNLSEKNQNTLEDEKNEDEKIHLNIKENEENINDMTKCEINKLKIFQEKKNWQKFFIFTTLNKIMFLCFIFCFIFSIMIYKRSQKYFKQSKRYINGLNIISDLFNYTLTSANFFMNNLLYKKLTNISNDLKKELSINVSSILKNNSQYMYNLLSITDLTLFFIINEIEKKYKNNDDKNPNLMLLQYLLYTDNNTLTFENRNFSFIEANNDIMSSINSISNNINENNDESLKDIKPFYLCNNCVNNYYIKVFDLIEAIFDIFNNLFPKTYLIILFFISLFCNIGLMLYYLYIAQKIIVQINQIILEFLSIKNSELQEILKICSEFIKKVKKDSNYEFEMHEDDDNKIKEKKRKNDGKKNIKEFLEEKLNKIKKNIIIKMFFILIFVLMILEIFFVINYLRLESYKRNSDNFIDVYYSIQKFYSNLNLINNGMKLEYLVPSKYNILNLNIRETLSSRFNKYLSYQDNMTYYLETRQKYSSNFTNYYNKHIMLFYLPLIEIKIIEIGNSNYCKNLNEYSLNYAISNYYINSNELWEDYINNNINPIENHFLICADLIKDRLIIPYFKLIFNSLFIDAIKTANFNINIITISFTIYIISLFILTIGLSIPINHYIYKTNEKTKYLILLIPTKILINKKNLLETLKNEQMISLIK